MGNQLYKKNMYLCINLPCCSYLFNYDKKSNEYLVKLTSSSDWIFFINIIIKISEKDLGKEEVGSGILKVKDVEPINEINFFKNTYVNKIRKLGNGNL